MTLTPRRVACIALLGVMAAVLAGCSKDKLSLAPFTNQPPTVRVTAAPIDTNAVCDPDPARSCYSLTLNWVGYDPDGRVDHFIYAVDPEYQDTTWINTTDNERRLVFAAPAQTPTADSLSILRGFHTFVIAAVDERGATGPRVSRSFFSFTQAPRVEIRNPTPRQDEIVLPPSVRFSWIGFDDDGVFTTKPVRYRYMLLGPNSNIPVSLEELAGNPALIRRFWAPEFSAAAGWLQVGGDTTTVQFTGLIPSAHYLFLIVAFDEAGAFSPNVAVVRFQVGYAAAAGPAVTVFNEFFFFTFPKGYNTGPQFWVNIEVPAATPITFFWVSVAPDGSDPAGSRWMVDGDIQDETEREDETTDQRHWSALSLQTFSARIGPFASGEHFFYIESRVNTGLKTLCTIHMRAVAPTFEKELLFVDDTRFSGDQFLADGSFGGPNSAWPSASEADTFFHAIGGVPWKYYGTFPNPPANSPPGILKGYEYDTLNTRTGLTTIGVSLATLGKYRHVMWMTDLTSAGYDRPGYDPNLAMTALRYGATPGRLNTLGAYLRQGGEAWLCGSGGAFGMTVPFNDRNNDGIGGDVYFKSPPVSATELIPGRFMVDVAKWQSEFRSIKAATGPIVRSLGRFASTPDYPTNQPCTPKPGTAYAAVPPILERRTPASDPAPPLRSGPSFYNLNFSAEAVTQINQILEPINGDIADLRLDTFEESQSDIQARWKSSDPANTKVFRDDVTQTGTRASGTAMKITSQGAASAGDRVRYTFITPLDFSAMREIRVTVKQDQPTSAVQWRVRIMGDVISTVVHRDRSAICDTCKLDTTVTDTLRSSALIPLSTTNQFVDVSISIRDLQDEGSRPVRLTVIRAIEFELATSSVAGTSWFDQLVVASDPDGSALDTLMTITGSGFPGQPNPPLPGSRQRNATMTYYHGHDVPKPFVMSGFAPYGFKRAQCMALVDFVFQKLWGIQRRTGPLPLPGPGDANDLTGGRVISYPMVSTAAPTPTRPDVAPRPKGTARDTYRSVRTTRGSAAPNGGARP